MERQFNACQTTRSIYLSVFNSFRVTRCLSQCVSPKIAIFYHILVSPGDTPGAITLNIVWMKENSMLTNSLAECAHLTITVSKIERDIGRKSSFFHTPFHSTPPLRGFPSEHRHPVWRAKTRMAWLPQCFEDIFIRFGATHERYAVRTDGQTDTGWRHIPRLCIASRGKK